MKRILNKRIFSVILAVAMIMCSAPLTGFIGIDAYAYTDGMYEYTIENGEATIVGCNEEPSGDIVIPETLGGYPVVSIEDFHSIEDFNEMLTSISFPSSLETICDDAFSSFWALESIKFNEGLEVIERYAFSYCESLEEIVMPDTVTCISDYAFYCCTSLKFADLGNSETMLMDYDVFEDCESLAKIIIGEANRNYYTDEYGVLYGKSKTGLLIYPPASLMTEYTVDDNTAYIADGAFEYSKNLEKVILPQNLVTIGSYSFRGCSKLKSIIIPDKVEFINANAFSQCTNLRMVNLGNSENLKLDYEIFAESTSIERITISKDNKYYCTDENGVLYNKNKTAVVRYPAASATTEYTVDENAIYINDFSFEGSSNLKTITLPEGLMSVGLYSFRYCENITDVYYGGSKNNWRKIDFSSGNKCLTDATIHFAKEFFDYEYTIENGEVTITEYIGYDEDVVIPSTIEGYPVTKLDEFVFGYCSGNSIFIPDSVISIDFSNFGSFENSTFAKFIVDENNPRYSSDADGVLFNKDKTIILKYPRGKSNKIYEIPYGVEKVGETAFSSVYKLTSVTIPGSVTSIGYYAFSCSNIKTVTLSEGLEKICNSAFMGCSYLESIDLPYSVYYIDQYAFNQCDNIKAVKLSKNITHLGRSAFSDCDSLISIEVDEDNENYITDSNGVIYTKDEKTLVQYPAGNPSEIHVIPDGVTTIDDYAFEGAKKLVYVEIPDSVISIDLCAFSHCDSLASIEIPDSVTSIDWAAFFGCDSLTSVTIGNSVTNIGDSAFIGCDNLNDVYYNGTEEEWNEITIGSDNEYLINATIHFLGEKEECTHAGTEVRDVLEATCTEKGYTGDTYCTICDEFLEEGEEIDVIPHFGCTLILEEGINPTCTEAGYCYSVTYCMCGLEMSRIKSDVDALGHIWGEWKTVTEATEATEGEKERTCSACGESEKEKIPASGIRVTLTDSDGNIVAEKVISGDSTEVSFDGVEDAEYTISFSKENYVIRDYMVSASNGGVSTEFSINKVGDLNSDGKVNTVDVARANAHARGVSSLSGYEFSCADVNGDGRINTVDVSRMNAHTKGVNLLW